MQISLIVATCGRYEELREFFESLVLQSVGKDAFEIIVVDQNTSIDLTPLISLFSDQLFIHHIRSNAKGLSFNRNIGLEVASGEILAFPDDDCRYYTDSLENVLRCFAASPCASAFLGMIYDRKERRSVLREWPSRPKRVNQWNFYRLISSITLFCRKDTGRFDPRFGVGAKYGSNEDADFVLSAIRNGSVILYTPAIQVWHPEVEISGIALSKTRAYGVGFGAFVAKHSIFSCGVLLLLSFGFQIAKMVQALLGFNWPEVKRRWVSACSRLLGSYYFILGDQDSQ